MGVAARRLLLRTCDLFVCDETDAIFPSCRCDGYCAARGTGVGERDTFGA
jgi:hypothetical protein